MKDFIGWLAEYWNGLPRPLTAIVALIIGLLAAKFTRLIVTKTMTVLRANKLGDRLGASEFLRKGGVEYSLVQLAGILSFWLVMGATFLYIAASLDISVIRTLWGRILEILPGLLAGFLILALGIIAVTFFANFALTIARNAAMPNAGLISKGVKFAGILIVALVALDQLGLKGNVLSYLLMISFAAVALGAALAFGIGCKDIARVAMERFLKNLRERGRGSHPTDLEG